MMVAISTSVAQTHGEPVLTKHLPSASEALRQIELLERGVLVKQETRGFDEEKAQTYSLRSKEDAPDYRYMPDPNIPPLLIDSVRWPEA